jgi:hypothetical protein
MRRAAGIRTVVGDDHAHDGPPSTPLRVAEAASRAFGWPLHVIEDAADDPAMDQPEAFAATPRSAIDPGGGAK